MAAFDYTTKEAVKSELETGSGATYTSDYDSVIEAMIAEASRLIDRYKGVENGAYVTGDQSADDTRYYFGSGGIMQEIDYITSITSIAVEETDGTYTAWTSTDYHTWPYNASGIDEPIRRLEVNVKSAGSKSVWTWGQKRVKVVGAFGVAAAVPSEVGRAAKIQVQRWVNRMLQGWNDTGAIPDLGQLQFTQSLDPDVKLILDRVFPRVGRIPT